MTITGHTGNSTFYNYVKSTTWFKVSYDMTSYILTMKPFIRLKSWSPVLKHQWALCVSMRNYYLRIYVQEMQAR